MSDFQQAARLGALISKDYAESFFKLLVNYRTISASEAASRLDLHIRTAQDFLESLADLDLLEREEVREGKRPYFRYTLIRETISLHIDLIALAKVKNDPRQSVERIREKVHSGARFATARGGSAIASVSFWVGEGRDQRERRINLTPPQGKFLFHLPFPSAPSLSTGDIMKKAGVEEEHLPEIMDIVSLLSEHGIIETVN